MKGQLTSLDLHFLVKELKLLEGARIDKAYQGEKEEKHDFTFQFRKKEEGKLLLRVILPGLLFFTEEKRSYGKMPGPFAVFLRKHLGNATLNRIEQRAFERILELEFENKKGTFLLLFELLPPGNALLLNNEGKIINLLVPQRHGQRLLRGGAIYKAPPPLFNTRDASEEELVERLFTSDKDSIVKSLAIDLSLGGVYAEEVCARAGIEKEAKPSKVTLQNVAKEVKALFTLSLSPTAYGDEIFPFALITKEGGTAAETFSSLVAKLVPDVAESKVEAANKATRTRKEKAEEVLRKQTEQLEGLRRAEKENQEKGELIYAHYQTVRAILKEINTARKKQEWKAVKAAFKDRVIKIDENKAEVTVELE